jgi:hypothetical protein
MAENPALKDIDFSKLRFQVHGVPHGTELLLKFPELQAYPEIATYKHADRNYVIRYVIYMYDMHSGLIQKFPELKQRKEFALELAGFERDPNTGKFKSEIYKMINLEKIQVKVVSEEEDSKDKTVTESNRIFEMVMCYIKLQNNRLWSMIVTTEQAFLEYQGLIMEPVSERGDKDTLAAANTKDKLMESCYNMNKRIDEYYKELFGDNEDLKNVVKKKPVRPETMTKS